MLIQSGRYLAAAAATAFVLLVGCTSEQRTSATGQPSADLQAQPSPQARSSAAQGESTRSVAEVADDAIITGKVKAALVDVEGIKVSDVNVDTIKGTVTLKGLVENQAQADHAIRLARATEGVLGVSSELVVKAAR
jgi:osmotically-inducible protein OsmY